MTVGWVCEREDTERLNKETIMSGYIVGGTPIRRCLQKTKKKVTQAVYHQEGTNVQVLSKERSKIIRASSNRLEKL